MGTKKQKPFREWLKREMFHRDWSIRHLASQINYSHSHISYVVNGKKEATFEFCNEVAKAFGEPAWRLFVMAGLMEPPGDVELDEETSVIVDIYRQMPRAHQHELYEYISWYGTRHAENENNDP